MISALLYPPFFQLATIESTSLAVNIFHHLPFAFGAALPPFYTSL